MARSPVRRWNCAIWPALLLLAGCDQRPVAGPIPLPVAGSPAIPAYVAPVGTDAALSQPPGAGSSLAPAKGGFSLPIGGDIQPLPAPVPANVASSQENQNPAELPPFHPQSAPPAAAPSPAAPPKSTGLHIQLSAGVAVPQSLPIGTVMGLSADYQVSGNLNPASRYFWVVKSAAGEAVNEVQLQDSGTLSAFFAELKPQHRPFSVRIEELSSGSRRRAVVSNELPLQTSY